MTTPAIETHGLTKRFGDVLALEGLDLRVERGDVYGFLGPNGAGKSTTINLLLDFIEPTAGSATVLGHEARSESLAVRERIGILPEGGELYPRLSGREHLEFVADVKGVETEPAAILERVGLDEPARTRPVGSYSKGMRQRLALGMALVGDPDLLLLDEPSAGLDPNGMAEFRTLLRETAADGTTVFFSSHILAAVEAVCDRIGILHEGQLVAEDTIENLRERAGVAPLVKLECATPPETDLGLSTFECVRSVERDGRWLAVTCRSPADKPAVIRHADDAASLTNVVTEQASLEALFERYTSGETIEREKEESTAARGTVDESTLATGVVL